MAKRITISLEKEDEDILAFFSGKGMDVGSCCRAALRQYYEWYSSAAASGINSFMEKHRQEKSSEERKGSDENPYIYD